MVAPTAGFGLMLMLGEKGSRTLEDERFQYTSIPASILVNKLKKTLIEMLHHLCQLAGARPAHAIDAELAQ